MTEIKQELASRWQRLWGALLDGLIALAIVFPVMWISGLWQQLIQGEQMSVEQRIWMFIFGVILFFVLQGYLLAKHGQTIGKRIVGTRIVSAEDGQLVPLSRIFWLRNLPVSLIAQIPTFGSWLSVIDALFIFRKDKRCIHDLIAGTKVVKAGQKNSVVAVAPAVTASKPTVIAGRMETPTLQKKENSPTMNDDAFYDEVAKEMRENQMVPCVWARAFAEADGDENRAKAIYIKRRVAQLSENSKPQIEGKKQDELSVLKKRAEQEDSEAQWKLGLMHYFGTGVPKDYKEAAKWFRLAADQGNADAQNSLGVICFNGHGTRRDYVQAFAWFSLAAEQGNEKAKKSLSMIMERMTPAAIEEGRQKAREYAKKVGNGGSPVT